MALIDVTVHAASLGFRTRISVAFPTSYRNLLPEGAPFYIPPKPAPDKILYLLHGLSDDAGAWVRNTRIETYAEDRGYIVIMPEVQRSFYTDMKHGSQYFHYLTDELPKLCEEMFNIKHTRERTFIAGLSMGGYGALKAGLSRPDFYSACAGFSGALDVSRRLFHLQPREAYREIGALYGDATEAPDHADVYKLATKMATLPSAEQSRVLVTCGEQDFLLDDNRKMAELLKTLPIDHAYEEWPGVHDWPFWDESIVRAFDFFER